MEYIVYLVLWLVVALLGGRLFGSWMKSQNKWGDPLILFGSAFILGIALLFLKKIVGVDPVFGFGFWFSVISYIYGYYYLYSVVQKKHSKKTSFLSFVHLNVRSKKYIIDEFSADGVIGDALRESLWSERLQESTKAAYDSGIKVQGAFWGWLVWLFYGLGYAGIAGFGAYQDSLGSIFSSFYRLFTSNEDMRIIFWVVVAGGAFLLVGKIFGWDE